MIRARTVAVVGAAAALGAGIVARLRRRSQPRSRLAPAAVPAALREPEAQPEPAETARPAYAPPVRALAGGGARAPLRGISEIRRFFRTNETPIWFVSATPFNLLGIDRWVRNFAYLNYYDSFDGRHPNVFVPRHVAPPTFDSIEEICNYLLAHKEVVDHVKARGPGKAVFLMFDEETERLADGRRARGRLPARRAAHAARLEDRDDAARRRGRGAERAQHARPRLELRRAARARRGPRASAPISSCRRRTATRARRPSSSRPRTTGTSTRRRWWARS